jgi:hypothetical protein
MRNNTGNLKMGTKVINAAVSPRPSDELEEPVEMTFEKNIVSNYNLSLSVVKSCCINTTY